MKLFHIQAPWRATCVAEWFVHVFENSSLHSAPGEGSPLQCLVGCLAIKICSSIKDFFWKILGFCFDLLAYYVSFLCTTLSVLEVQSEYL